MKEFTGEFIGTFIMVLFGCGSVATAVLFNSHLGIFTIAIVWGLAIALGIYAVRMFSCAHFNPAVTLAMAVAGRLTYKKVPVYLAGQFVGALVAAMVLYVLFNPSITAFEAAQGIVRGTPESMATAKMFGEFYRLAGDTAAVSMPLAMFGEGIGTFILVLVIFFLTESCNQGRPDGNIAPVLIGLTVSSLICLIAPLTQAGFNPARDFAPRLVAWLAGWGAAAFPDMAGGFFWVYILAPLIGGVLAAGIFCWLLEPLFLQKAENMNESEIKSDVAIN